MDLNLHLQNLPQAATNVDIRRFFSSLEIPEGGVQIIGGEDGDAFITFSLEEDLLKALMFDKQPLLGQPVSLFLAREADIERVITKRSKELEKTRKRISEGSNRHHECPTKKGAYSHNPSASQNPEDGYRNSNVSLEAKDLYARAVSHLHDEHDSEKHQLKKQSQDPRSSVDKSKKRKDEEEDFDISLPFHALATQRDMKKRDQGHHSEPSAGGPNASITSRHSKERALGVPPWLREESPSPQALPRGHADKKVDHHDHGHSSKDSSSHRHHSRGKRDSSNHRKKGERSRSSKDKHDRGSSREHREDSRSSRGRHERSGQKERRDHSSSRDRYHRESKRDSRSVPYLKETAKRNKSSKSPSPPPAAKRHHSSFGLQHFAVYNLDVTVTAADLRTFFTGHVIPEGGIILKSDPHVTSALIAYIACYRNRDGESAASLSDLMLHTRQVTVKLIPKQLYDDHKSPEDKPPPSTLLSPSPPPNYDPYGHLPLPQPMMYPGPMWSPQFPPPFGMPPMAYGSPPPGYGPPPNIGAPSRYPMLRPPYIPHQRSPSPPIETLPCYLRLKNLPKDSTAFGIWQSLGGKRGRSKNVTLIYDPSNNPAYAYVAYQNNVDRKEEFERKKYFAKPCSYHALKRHLHNLEHGWRVVESTWNGNKDRASDFLELRDSDGNSRHSQSPYRSHHHAYEKRKQDEPRQQRPWGGYSVTKSRRLEGKDREVRPGSDYGRATRKRYNSESSISSTLSVSPVTDYSGGEEKDEEIIDTIRVCARNFPLAISEKEVEDYFKEFNPITKSARIEWDDEVQYASIKFKLNEEASAAINALNGKMYTLDNAHEKRIIKVYREDQRPPIKYASKGSSKKSYGRLDKKSVSKKSAKESNKRSSKKSNGQSDKASARQSDKASGRQSDKASGKQSGRASGTQSGKASGIQAEKASAKQSEEASGKQSDKTSGKQSGKQTGKASGKQADNASDKQSNKSSGKQSNRSSGKHPDKASGKPSDKTGKKLDKTSKCSDKIAGKQSNKTGKTSKKTVKLDTKVDNHLEETLDKQLDEQSGKNLADQSTNSKKSDKQLENESVSDITKQHGLDKQLDKLTDSHLDRQTDDALNTDGDIDLYGDLEEPAASDKQGQTDISLATADMLFDLDSDIPGNDRDNHSRNGSELIDDEVDTVFDKPLENEYDKLSTNDLDDELYNEGEKVKTEVSKLPDNNGTKQEIISTYHDSEEQSSHDLKTQMGDEKHVDIAVDDLKKTDDNDLDSGGLASDIDIYAEIEEQSCKEVIPSLDLISQMENGLDT